MARITPFIIATAVAVFSCTERPTAGTPAPTGDPNFYSYDSSTGKCVNYLGREGYNTLDREKVYNTKNCECMDLGGEDLVYLLDSTTIDNWHPFGHNMLDSFNFRGARLDNARLFFNDIRFADFRGASMRTLKFGYATIYGRIDEFTEVPEGSCTATGDSLHCRQ